MDSTSVAQAADAMRPSLTSAALTDLHGYQAWLDAHPGILG